MPEDEILQVCECVYEVVERQDEEGNIYNDKVLVTQCDYCTKEINHKLFKEANINEDLWDLCTVVDGVIYTPQVEVSNEKSLDEKIDKLELQLNAASEMQDFYEECIVEIAGVVYG